jgi:hypothetical protein
MVDDYAANAGNVVKNAVSGRPVADVRAAFRNLKMGIDLSHRGHKVKRVQAFLKRAENRGNTDKQIRTAMLRMLDNPRHTMGMTRAEIQALEKVAKGGAWRNIFKFGGEFAPDSKLGMITGGSIGFALGSAPAGISIMGAGMLAKKGADIAARGDVKKLQRLIRAGGLKTPLSPTQYALSSPDAQQIVGRAAALGLMPMTAQLGNQ